MPLVRLATEEEPAPNLAPMIDVILVLTIFFMCATKFSADERRFDLDLPQADGAADQAAPGPEVVEVAADGSLRLAGTDVSLAALAGRLEDARATRPDLAVTIRGERTVSHGRMTEIYEVCRVAGVRHVAIAVRSRDDPARR